MNIDENILLQKMNKLFEPFSKAIEYEPNNAMRYIERGDTYMRWNIPNKALEDYNKAIELDQYNAEFYIRRARTYSRMQQDKRLDDYNKAAELDPHNPAVYSNRGDAYNQASQYENALKDFCKAIELDPSNTWAHLQCGYIYQNINRHDKAIEKFTQILNSNQELFNCANLYYDCACSYRVLEQYGQAEEAFAKAIELSDDVYKQRYRELWEEDNNDVMNEIMQIARKFPLKG